VEVGLAVGRGVGVPEIWAVTAVMSVASAPAELVGSACDVDSLPHATEIATILAMAIISPRVDNILAPEQPDLMERNLPGPGNDLTSLNPKTCAYTDYLLTIPNSRICVS
jgi:hypothetical protein